MIDDKVIDGYLRSVFGDSEPGTDLHRMVFVCAGAADRGALGFPVPGKLHVTLYALAPDGSVDTDQFIAQAIVAAVVEARGNGLVPYFVALGKEHVVVDSHGDVAGDLARLLHADRRLQEHPNAVEVTQLYAACRDGRRWVGTHVLTGARAGSVSGPQVRVGPVRGEAALHEQLLREAVELRDGGGR